MKKYLQDYKDKSPVNCVKNVMSTNLIYVSATDTVVLANEIMNKMRIRHLLVVDSQNLVGVLSINDIPNFIKPQLQVFSIMTINPISIQVYESIDKARDIIQTMHIGILPVLEREKLVGVITAKDIF